MTPAPHPKPYVLLIATLIVFQSISQPFAQTYKWDNVPIGGGGYITGLVVHPAEPNLIYARTDVGGAYRYEAPNAQHPNNPKWIPITEWIPYDQDQLYGVDGIAIDPNNTNTVYAALGGYDWTTYSDVYKSTNRGESWIKCNLNKKFRGNQGDRWIGEPIAVKPGNSNFVLVGTRYDGLWKSTDAGSSWNQVSGISTDAGGRGVRAVVFDPNNPNRVYCNARGSGVYQSTDGGNSWSLISGSDQSSRRLAVASDGTLYITGNGALYKYKNNSLTSVSPDRSFNYNGIAVSPTDPDFVVISRQADWIGVEIFKSTNGGETWTNIFRNAPKTNAVPWYSLGWFSSAPSCMFVNPNNTDELYLGDWYLVWKSSNIKDAAPAFSSVPWGHEELVVFDIAALPSKGILIQGCADNGGLKHTSVTEYPTVKFGNQESIGVDFCEANNDVFVRVSSDGWGVKNFNISKTINGGTSWTQIHSPGTTGKIVMSSTDHNVMIFAPTGGNQNLKYTHNSTTWNNSSGIPATTFNPGFWDNYSKPIAADKKNGNKFYCFANGTMYVSTDKGATFSAAATDLPKGSGYYVPVRFLKASPYAEGHLWLSIHGSGLFYSTNSGNSFTKVGFFSDCKLVAVGPVIPGSSHPTVFSFGRNATTGWGVYRSTDYGTTWAKITDDKMRISNSPRAMDADRQTPGRVYVGTGGRGLYYGDIAGTTGDTRHSGLNPRNQGTTRLRVHTNLRKKSVRILMPADGSSMVKVYNISGRQVFSRSVHGDIDLLLSTAGFARGKLTVKVESATKSQSMKVVNR